MSSLGGRAVQIAAGVEHTWALLDTGKVRCWGANAKGQLGYGHTRDIGDDEAPAAPVMSPWTSLSTQVVAGAFHTCALLGSGLVRCWGASPKVRLARASMAVTSATTRCPPRSRHWNWAVGSRSSRVSMVRPVHSSRAAQCAAGERWIGSTADRYTPAAKHPLVDLGVPAVRLGSGAAARSYLRDHRRRPPALLGVAAAYGEPRLRLRYRRCGGGTRCKLPTPSQASVTFRCRRRSYHRGGARRQSIPVHC